MNKIIDCYVISIILDYLVSVIVKDIENLSIKKWQLLFFQIFTISSCSLFIFCNLELYQFVLIRLFFQLITTLLIVDEYKKRTIFLTYANFLILTFAVFGVSIFLTEFFKFAIIDLFKVKVSQIYILPIFLFQFLFVIMIMKITKIMQKERTLKQFLSKVSFSINNKHIEITGLLDSGNSLYDTKTGNPVIVVSSQVLKNIIDKYDYLKFLNGTSGVLSNSREISFVGVGGVESKIPIIDNVSVVIKNKEFSRKFNCAVGFINQTFANSRYDCLIHKDFF